MKNTRGLHFCQIVTVDQLQKQLAQDVKRPAACRALTSLLLNSYYPQNKVFTHTYTLQLVPMFHEYVIIFISLFGEVQIDINTAVCSLIFISLNSQILV